MYKHRLHTNFKFDNNPIYSNIKVNITKLIPLILNLLKYKQVCKTETTYVGVMFF